MMIQCQNIQKYYGAELVLSDVTFEIKEGETVGLIGRNGSGKTTMMKLLTGSESPDQGQLFIRKNTRIGALSQIPDVREGETVHDVLLTAFTHLRQMQEEMQRLETEMAAASTGDSGNDSHATLDVLLGQYGALQEAFERGGGYDIEASIEKVSAGLSIPADQLSRPFSTLSGGEKTKIGLAVILLQQPDLLLLDEPTNHLDMAAIEWLESFLRSFAGTIIVISHDRYFLDAVTSKIVELEDGEAFTYLCSYSAYKEEKERRLLQQFADYQEQQKKIKKMQETIKQLIEWGNRSNPPNPGFHRRAASMQKALDRMVKLKRPILERKRIDLQLQQSDRSGKDAIVLREVGTLVSGRRLFSGINHTLRYGETAALIGGNGAGKSTLLKNILGLEAHAEGEIRLGSRVDVGYLAQQAAPSDHDETVLQYFRDEIGIETGEARNQLARFLFYGPDVFKKVSSLSGGEWTRLRLAVLMHRKPNLLLLDEPTNHLDIDSREALEEALEEYPGTLLAVSHDRYFINKIAGQVWELQHGKMRVTFGSYEDYKAELARMVEPAVVDKSHEGREKNVVKASEDAPAGASAKKPKPGGKTQANPSLLRKLEGDIAALEEELATVDAAMLEPVAAIDAVRLTELQSQRDGLQQYLDELTERYLTLLDESEE